MLMKSVVYRILYMACVREHVPVIVSPRELHLPSKLRGSPRRGASEDKVLRQSTRYGTVFRDVVSGKQK